MAKRATATEGPYRPLLDANLLSMALAETSAPRPAAPKNADNVAPVKVAEPPRIDPPRRIEQIKPDVRDSEPEPLKPTAPPLFEKIDQEKRVLFTKGESQAIDRLVASLAVRLGTQVKSSHVMRALVALLLHAESELDKRAGEAGTLVRPANGDAQALQRFEREIANIIADALRDAGPIW